MLYKILPYWIFEPLFGDRKRWGLKTDYQDQDFLTWQNESYLQFYQDNQKGKIGTVVNHYGFKIMQYIDMTNKVILEVGPGKIEHIRYNNTKPQKYILADINEVFLNMSAEELEKSGISTIEKLRVESVSIPLEDQSVDVVVTFHQLEHIYELDAYIAEIKRILKSDGILIGAVPSEGGVAWGMGRFLTSRRYVKKNMNFDYDKIICWEHPNFVDKIQSVLEKNFTNLKSVKKPFPYLPLDMNLSWSFVYRNDKL